MDANRFTILSSLTRLRLHAALIDSAYEDVPSSKIDTLIDQILDVAAGGHRALVFSQFTGFLGRVVTASTPPESGTATWTARRGTGRRCWAGSSRARIRCS